MNVTRPWNSKRNYFMKCPRKTGTSVSFLHRHWWVLSRHYIGSTHFTRPLGSCNSRTHRRKHSSAVYAPSGPAESQATNIKYTHQSFDWQIHLVIAIRHLLQGWRERPLPGRGHQRRWQCKQLGAVLSLVSKPCDFICFPCSYAWNSYHMLKQRASDSNANLSAGQYLLYSAEAS